MTGPLTIFDKPNSYIGRSVPREDAKRLLEGQGRYVDDLQLPRMVHASFVRSPHAHAQINSIDMTDAVAAPGVLRVLTGADLVGAVEPYVGTLTHLAGLRSPPQMPMAVDVARWQGEPVAMVIAQSRAQAEDAAELVEVDYTPLDPACDVERALDDDATVIHDAFGSNLAWERLVDIGDVEGAFKGDDVTVVERVFQPRI